MDLIAQKAVATKAAKVALQEYFTWHATQRQNDPEGINTNFLVMTCLMGRKCGGTSDRMRPLAYYLHLGVICRNGYLSSSGLNRMI